MPTTHEPPAPPSPNEIAAFAEAHPEASRMGCEQYRSQWQQVIDRNQAEKGAPRNTPDLDTIMELFRSITRSRTTPVKVGRNAWECPPKDWEEIRYPLGGGGIVPPPGYCVVRRKGETVPTFLNLDFFRPDWDRRSADDLQRVSVILMIALLTMVEQPTKLLEGMPCIAWEGPTAGDSLHSMLMSNRVMIGERLRASYEREWPEWLAWAWANRLRVVNSEPPDLGVTISPGRIWKNGCLGSHRRVQGGQIQDVPAKIVTPPDLDSYVLAKEIMKEFKDKLGDQLKNHHNLRRILEKNPQIRTHKPYSQRLLIHFLDFRQVVSEMLNTPDDCPSGSSNCQ